MRGDQPLRAAASPTVNPATRQTLTRACKGCSGRNGSQSGPHGHRGRRARPPEGGTRRPRRTLPADGCPVCHGTVPVLRLLVPGADGRRLRLGGAGAAVVVFEPNDVVDLGRRDLEDGRVLERGHPVDGAGAEAEGSPRADDLLVLHRVTGARELDLGPPRLDEPGLVLLAVELQRERVTGADEEHLAAVVVAQRPDQLVDPRLLDPPRLEAPLVERVDVRRVQLAAHVGRSSHASHSGCAATCSLAMRSSFAVLTVSQRPSWRYACRRRSRTSSGNVVVSWSPTS